MSERKTLIESLKATVLHFKSRSTIGRMDTEHSIFIPTTLMNNQAEETREFILQARYINKQPHWNCPVKVEQITMRGIAGVEFVFKFSPDTDFNSIIQNLESKIAK
jgi:hypothetical protein